jgi:hypothetical protein
MLAITTRTKEIIAAWDEQQNMSDMISVAADKALTLFTQLSDVLVVVRPSHRATQQHRPDKPSGHNCGSRCGFPTYTEAPGPL